MRKQLLVAGIATAVGITGLTGVGIASAATNAATSPMSGLVEAISTKFNLNKTDVQAVFDEQRTKMQAEREAEVKQEVAQLVTDGKLTQDQADKINAKRAELQKAREAAMTAGETKTREERKSEVDAKRTELETWATDNGIDTEYLRFVMGHGGRGHGGPRD
jgi:uncharacterized protein (DUF305 family)